LPFQILSSILLSSEYMADFTVARKTSRFPNADHPRVAGARRVWPSAASRRRLRTTRPTCADTPVQISSTCLAAFPKAISLKRGGEAISIHFHCAGNTGREAAPVHGLGRVYAIQKDASLQSRVSGLSQDSRARDQFLPGPLRFALRHSLPYHASCTDGSPRLQSARPQRAPPARDSCAHTRKVR